MLGRDNKRETRSESTAERRSVASPSSRFQSKVQVYENFKPADVETTSILHGVCGRLGHLPLGSANYVLSVDFADALDDLVRLLAGDEGRILLKLGEMQIVTRHLVPMLLIMEKGRFQNSLSTLLNLLILLTCQDVVANCASYENLLDYRRQYKKAFESKFFFEKLLNLAITCVAPRRRGNMGEDLEILKKIFTLVKNILAIPDASISYSSSNVALASSFGRHERIVFLMKDSRFLEFLIVAANSCNDTRDGKIFTLHVPLLVEIFQYLLCPFDPDMIASVHDFGKEGEEGPKTSTIEQSIQVERKPKKPIRHCRFSGTLAVRLATGENYMLSGSRISEKVLTLDDKKRVESRIKKVTLDDVGKNCLLARSSEKKMILDVALDFIKDCLGDLLISCANQGNRLERDSKLDWNLSSLQAWCLRLCRQLHLCKSDLLQLEYIYPVLEVENLTSHARILRKSLNEKQHRLLLADMLFFRESFRMLDLMIYSPNPLISEAARHIEVGLFYREEILSVFRLVIESSKRFSLKILTILVETNHVMLKLLEKYCCEKSHVFTTRRKDRNSSVNAGESSEEEDQFGVEREFFFDIFLADYANESVVNSYTRLLNNARNLDVNTNRFVATMLTRFGSQVKRPEILFRVSVLNAIHSILTYYNTEWRRRNAVLLKVGIAISKAFLDKAQKNPSLIIAAFFNYASVATKLIRSDREALLDSSIGTFSSGTNPVNLPLQWSSEEKIMWLVKCLVDKEMSSQISWLCGKLYDAATARALSLKGSQEIASELVPDFCTIFPDCLFLTLDLYAQTDSIKEAFSCSQFCTLLIEAGAIPPNNEDKNWRIPGSIHSDLIIQKASLIQNACREEAEEVEEAEEAEEDDALAAMTKPKVIQKENSKIESRNELEDSLTGNVEEYSLPSSHTSRQGATTTTPIQSRWKSLKRNNFFLAIEPDDAKEDHDNYNDNGDYNYNDNNENDSGKSSTKSKRPPIAIYSDDEE